MADLVGEPGAARAARVLVVEPHEVVDDELAATLEEVGQGQLGVPTAEHVLLVDLDHRQPPALGVQGVALAREALLLLEQLLAGGDPLLAGDHIGQIQGHRGTIARTNAPAESRCRGAGSYGRVRRGYVRTAAAASFPEPSPSARRTCRRRSTCSCSC